MREEVNSEVNGQTGEQMNETTKELQKYRGYPLHIETKPSFLRAWNQLATMKVVNDDKGEQEAAVYLSLLPDIHSKQVKALALAISVKGYDYVKAELVREQQKQ